MYIAKTEFGWNRRTGWLHGDEVAYNACVRMWENRPKGRERTRPIHPSWSDYLTHFNPNDKERSQRAFCAFTGINPAAFSSALCKPITQWYEVHISIWIEELEKQEPNE